MRPPRNRNASAVLVVSEDQNLMAALREGLGSGPHCLETAVNAVTAYQYLESRDFACVVLDLEVRQLHWDDLLLLLQFERIETPAVVVTEGHRHEHRVKGFPNVADFFPRRAEPAQIVAAVRRHLACARPAEVPHVDGSICTEDQLCPCGAS